MSTDLRKLIDRALTPIVHGDDSDHCPACFGACGGWSGEWAEGAEELAAALAEALESMLDKIEDRDGMVGLLMEHPWLDNGWPDGYCPKCLKVIEGGCNSPSHAEHLTDAVRAYLLGEENSNG